MRSRSHVKNDRHHTSPSHLISIAVSDLKMSACISGLTRAERSPFEIWNIVSLTIKAGAPNLAFEMWEISLESPSIMKSELLRFNGALLRDPTIDTWMKKHSGELGTIAHHWFEVIRTCGDEVRELLHDGCPVACLGDTPFACVNVFTSHVNVGFFLGAGLPDPARLLQGTGKFMRHVKLTPGAPTNTRALSRLIHAAYSDIKSRVENG
jgi:hypothetical protein